MLDIGRQQIEKHAPRTKADTITRWLLTRLVPQSNIMAIGIKLGRIFSFALPKIVSAKLPTQQTKKMTLPVERGGKRTMIGFTGCVQSAATPNTWISSQRILARLGISLMDIRQEGCCGAVNQHLSEAERAKEDIKRNIDAWWPEIERGAEAIVITASGCGSMIKDYGELMADNPRYREKAARVSELALDLSEVLKKENLATLPVKVPETKRVAVHCPCSLNHAQRLPDSVKQILIDLGFTLAITKEDYLCCGSAGTYSILQPAISNTLREQKLNALTTDNPDVIVTANIGCQLHLASASQVDVRHWSEIVDELLTYTPS
ncbi:glycolate oxidase subunit GlcF [Veronia nyctiphanis]|uniref:glycolate oxidase subunit GlcF n=1 Tax=Veronia nyctiphanis TaxID=1278244 RepID=UPI001F20300C|nr:glycolate oxidase subunit GlcF [Veronia nyctiphanis]